MTVSGTYGRIDRRGRGLRLKTTVVDAKNAPDFAAAAMVRALLAEEGGDLKAAAREWDVVLHRACYTGRRFGL